MTRSYIADIFMRRGFDAAMRAARFSQDQLLVVEVMVLSYLATGIAKPVATFTRNARGKQVKGKVIESATPAEIAEVNTIVGRRQTHVVKDAHGTCIMTTAVFKARLNESEQVRRLQALASFRGMAARA